MGDDTPSRTAAFFDVDGTLADTTIVHYYAYFRTRGMSRPARAVWRAAYVFKCLYYLILDRFSRDRLNIVFYKSYAGMSAEATKSQAEACFRDVISPRCYPAGLACVEDFARRCDQVVLVTGSLDFIMAPLGHHFGVDAVLAPGLRESDGRFTGDLDSPPVANAEKAKRMLGFACEHGIDLKQSYAYGDSIADLAMLEAVGHPQVVNPDNKLAQVARQRGWPIHRWTVHDAT